MAKVDKLSILGDWGSSSCRLYLHDGTGVIESITAPGIKFTPNVEDNFFDNVQPWLLQHGPLPAILCGMVGSNIGWRDAGYIDCPARPDELFKNEHLSQMIVLS